MRAGVAFALASAAALVAAVTVPGCALPDPGRAWYAERMPVYSTRSERGGTWVVRMPDGVNVPAVIFAAEEELVRRGYVVEEREATIDEGFLIARTSDARLNQRVVVDSQRLDYGADLAVRMSPKSDERTAQDIAERVLSRLGM